MSQAINEERWKIFLSPLTTLKQFRRQRPEKMDRDNIVGPPSISKNFAEHYNKAKKNEQTISGNTGDDEQNAVGCNDLDDDCILVEQVIKSENLPEEVLSRAIAACLETAPISSAVPDSSSSQPRKKEPRKQNKRAAVDNALECASSPKHKKIPEMSSSAREYLSSETGDDRETGIFNKLKSVFTGKKTTPIDEDKISSSTITSSADVPPAIMQSAQKFVVDPTVPTPVNVGKWNLKIFSSYIDFEQVVRLNLETDSLDASVASADMIAAEEETLRLLTTSAPLPSIEYVLNKEANVRLFLTFLLHKVCMRLPFGMKIDEQNPLRYFPACKFDFLFHTCDGKPIGFMEVKTSGAMNDKAFIQTLIKLIILQQLACKYDVDVSAVPVFAILSDGKHFVLMQITGEKIYLEQRNNMLHIRTTKVMESLFKMMEMSLNRIKTSTETDN